MTRLRRLALALALAFTACGTAAAKDKYGPSWLAGQDARPATVEAARTAVGYGDFGDPVGVEVKLWGDVGTVPTGNTVRLSYQLRIQTKAGEAGPLLGDAAHPDGVAYTLRTAEFDKAWNGLEASVDITREKLSAMTNLPKFTDWNKPLLLRVEPQLFDVTAGKFVTAGKPPCLYLVASVLNGKVTSVLPLPKWLSRSCGKVSEAALAVLGRLDDYDPAENRLQDFFFDVLLGRVTMQQSDGVGVVKAIPVALLKSDDGGYLKAYLGKIADGEKGENGRTFGDDLRAAGKAKLAEK